jgi:ribonuclease HII
MRLAQPVAGFRCEGTLERELRARGFVAVAGVDEVGRGALFGPVVAAAVILSPSRPVRGLNQASRMAMEMAVARLAPAPDFLLTDAMPLSLATPQRPLIKGDARCHAIAAASIVAKVWRDDRMRIWDQIFPEYGLAGHKGYFTPEHARALARYGPTPLHRLSFEPVRARSLFPVDWDPFAGAQMELFEALEAAS